MTRQLGTAATCEHRASMRLSPVGDIGCVHCHWIFRIGLAGSRWVNPKEVPSDG